MDKKQLKKNKLDLEYHGESQKRNALLILLTTGSLAFIGSFIWLRETTTFILGLVIILVISLISSWYYYKSTKRMEIILEEIEHI